MRSARPSHRLAVALARSLRLSALVACAHLGAAFAAVAPAEAQQRLAAGQARFTAGTATHPHQDAARRVEVSQSQTPFATILTCADSRVAPELLFDQGVGDLFVVRVAGNVAKPDEIGSVEYGTGHLGAQLLVVLGHSSCGAVKAVLESAEVHGSIPQLVAPIVPAVEKTKAAHPGLPGAQLLAKAVEANVWQSIDDLLAQSATLRDLVKAGKLQVVGAVYDLATGTVAFKGEHPEQARLLNPAGDSAHDAPAISSSGHAAANPAASASHATATGSTGHAPSTTAVHASSASYTSIAVGALVLGVLLYGAHQFSLHRMKTWTVGARLAVGFAAILLVLGGLAVESYVSMHTALIDFTEYRSDARHSTLGAEIQTEFLEMENAAKDLVILRTPEPVTRYQNHQARLGGFLKEGAASIEEPALVQKIRTIETHVDQHVALHADLQKAITANSAATIAAVNRRLSDLGATIDSEAGAIETEFIAQQNAAGPRIAAELQHTQSNVIWLGLAAIVLGAGLATIIARSITAPLRHLAASLGAGAAQTAAASSQISAASQSLAQGASEQAASLEETSASMEELSSMTKRNADNSQEAKRTTTETRAAATAGAGHMQAMETAMAAIKSASTDITKILKTIDEIAFQTNILALNAAVEAARAGEHGMGFAVVAEEVRALAQRSATAAKETAVKIEDSVNKSQQGALITAEVAKSFHEIQSRIERLDHLVGEIATASSEQTHGIVQMTTAIGQMDQVTQTNAGSAEETAAAAEELNSQAVMLREAVGELEALTSATTAPVRPTHTPATPTHRSATKPSPTTPKSHAPTAKTSRPEPVAAGNSDEFFK